MEDRRVLKGSALVEDVRRGKAIDAKHSSTRLPACFPMKSSADEFSIEGRVQARMIRQGRGEGGAGAGVEGRECI